MTFARKFNTFGGTNINIYLGNKTQKSNSNLPIVRGGGTPSGRTESGSNESGSNESGSNESGSNESETSTEDNTENGARNDTSNVNTREHNYRAKEEPGLENVVSTIATEHAEDDAKIDIIEGKLTKNWEKLYVELGKINSDTAYTQQNKSEITQFIQEIVAAALLQTI